jgi:hypothetical protein
VDAAGGTEGEPLGLARNRFDAMSTAPTTVSVSRPHPLSGGLHFTGSIIRLMMLFTYRKKS